MKRNIGFTLVELLIVIALIAILSVAVLATINPIEQANKARDASIQNDAAEVLNALERYYANSFTYPWMVYLDSDGGGQLTADDPIFLESTDGGFGVCYLPTSDANNSAFDTADCDTTTNFGILIETDELKSSFANKSPFQEADIVTNRLWVMKNAGSDTSIYVCFVPKANANRNNLDKMRCIDDGSAGVRAGVYRVNDGRCTSTVTDWNIPDFGEEAMFMCVPE